MLNSLLLSAAAKRVGRNCTGGPLPRHTARSTAAVARPWSPALFRSDNATFATDRMPVLRCRYLSNVPLRRPPRREQKNGTDGDGTQTWRSHTVSLGLGNYQDDYDSEPYGDYNDTSTPMDLTHSVDSAKTTVSQSSWHEDESELAEQVQEIQREDDEQRRRWLENAKPPVRHSIIDERGRAYGRGGRKTASARVWIQPGFGNVVINRKDFVDYFDRTSDRELILEPLAATETLGRFDIVATVEGGGLRGQAGAIRHGLARALDRYNPDSYRPPLKRLGYLTRDPRKVERKKIGHLKARKKPQWVKR